MARLIVAFAAVLLLTGCESDDGLWAPAQAVVDGAFGPSQETARPTTTAAVMPASDRCIAVAYARKADAKANGFDDDMQDQVYQRTYAECDAWDRNHAEIRQSN